MSELRELPDGWRWVQLHEVCRPDRVLIQPNSTLGKLPYLSLEHVQSKTGRILREPEETVEDEGKSTTFAFDTRHVLFGKLRPYLNKVALPDYAGRCTTEIIPLLPVEVDRRLLAWVLRREETVQVAMQNKTGSRMPRADMDDLLKMFVPVPVNITEQRRIADRIEAHMTEIAAARAAAEAELAAAEALAEAYLRQVFESEEAQNWDWADLREYTEFLAAGSIATQGDTEVRAITTACLTETGFNSIGIKLARMWAKDAVACEVAAGEVLIARSNTPELVGRVSMYPGEPKGIVASDLTIRIQTTNGLIPEFLTAYLSFLFLTGYWKDRAGGTSGTMKKITRTQLAAESIPVPQHEVQVRYVSKIQEHMSMAYQLRRMLEIQASQLTNLQQAVLEQAFSGEL